MRLTIRQRILLTFTLIFIIGGLVQLYIAGSRLQFAALEFFEHNLETEVLAAAAALGGSLEHFTEGEGGGQFSQGVFSVQRHTDTQYAVIDTRYHILVSSVDYSDNPILSETHEIQDAARRGIGSDTRGDLLYVAAPITEDGQVRGFLVLWASLDPAYADSQRHLLELVISTLPVLGLGIIGSLWIGRTISQPIQQLHTSALAMANGKLDTRINVESKDEIGELAHAFNFMAGRLEDLVRSQRNFVSNAAHELRTPLMNVKLRVEALQDANLPLAEHDAYLAEINIQVEHMAHMVTSLLTLARLDEGRHLKDNLIDDTASLLHDVARNWRIQAQKVGLTFHDDIPANLSEISMSNADLRIVLDNLLSNAVKYTKQGQINFVVSEDSANFTLKVIDTGAGFTPEEGIRLFERFFRADGLRTLPGTGLGLSIVEAIVSYYGGKIRASSEGVGRGTTFEVTLPKLSEKIVVR